MHDTEKPYEDDDYIEIPEYRTPSMEPGRFYHQIRHKKSGNMFRVLAENEQELANKVDVGDWDTDPRNEPEVDQEEDE